MIDIPVFELQVTIVIRRDNTKFENFSTRKELIFRQGIILNDI